MQTETIYVHPTAVVDAGARIGTYSSVWHFSHLEPGAVVKTGVTPGAKSTVVPGITVGRKLERSRTSRA